MRVSLYDARGRLIRHLEKAERSPGYYVRQWDGRDEHGRPVSSGAYFARLRVAGDENHTLVRKLTVLR